MVDYFTHPALLLTIKKIRRVAYKTVLPTKKIQNSVAFTGNKFVKIEFVAKLRNSELEYAVVRCMKSQKLVDSKHETEAVLFLYKIGKPGELEMIRAEELTK